MRYKCEIGGIPEVNDMLRKIAQDMGMSTLYTGTMYDNEFPHIAFSYEYDGITQLKGHVIDDVDVTTLPLPEFIALLKDYKKPVTTKFGGHEVILTNKVLKVGCNTFTVIEVKTFMEFLNKNIK